MQAQHIVTKIGHLRTSVNLILIGLGKRTDNKPFRIVPLSLLKCVELVTMTSPYSILLTSITLTTHMSVSHLTILLRYILVCKRM